MALRKKGEGVRKKSNFESMNKSDIFFGEEGEAKLMSFFQDVFQVTIRQFFSSSSFTSWLIFNVFFCQYLI